MDEAYEWICSKGIEPLGKPRTFQTGAALPQRAFYLKDPDGVLVTLKAFIRPGA